MFVQNGITEYYANGYNLHFREFIIDSESHVAQTSLEIAVLPRWPLVPDLPASPF